MVKRASTISEDLFLYVITVINSICLHLIIIRVIIKMHISYLWYVLTTYLHHRLTLIGGIIVEFFQLKSFREVADSGSFSKAAEKLNITQPALSRQIVALEKEFNLPLFNRHSRGVTLTEAGRHLYRYANNVLNLVCEAEKSLKEMCNLEIGTLSVGASTTIGNYLLPSWLSLFMKSHPGLDVSLQVGCTDEIVDKLCQGLFDLAFVGGSPDMPGVCIDPILEDEILLVASSNHPLSARPSVSPSDLAKEVFILRETCSATRQTGESILAQYNIKPSKTVSLGDTEAVKRAVINGYGVTFLSRFTICLELNAGLLTVLNPPWPKIVRPLLSIYLKNNNLSPAALALLSHIKKENCQV